jgi:hypothetical protein
MKMQCVLLSIFASGGAASADPVLKTYDDSKPPALPLPAAYERVYTAMGPFTNQFHCVSATITTNYSPEGQWLFIFCTTNKPPTSMRVTIDFAGKEVRVHNSESLTGPSNSAPQRAGFQPTPTSFTNLSKFSF